MRLYTLLKEVEIDYTNIADFSAQVESITDRSDRVGPGCVFVCVSGIRHDGHDYIEEKRHALEVLFSLLDAPDVGNVVQFKAA